ncbi:MULTISPECIES: fibronectin type III domain-containing protein [Streptomyces]|uniref:fibronectin type III domain-containing protein n=1 Tax=Streptomyces TaxID=1883 RepID=UPI00199BD5C0|nr:MULTISPECIES: fibronectin type III domain-containing protein [Streptomyces]GGT19666.1 hydrolase [Streptomyces toxytricini]
MPRTAALLRPGLAAALTALLAGCAGGDTTAPAAPAGLTAQAGSATSVHVMWNAAAAADGVANYQVFQDGRLVRDLPAEKTMTDITGLAPQTAYTFTVRARDAAGNTSAPSAAARTATPAAAAEDRRPPSAPTRTTARADGPRTVTLSWSAASDDTGVTAYDVYQAGIRIHTAGPGETSTSLTDLQPGTAYTFTVRARDGADNSSPDGPPAAATTPPSAEQGPATAPSGFTATSSPGAVDLAWTAPDTGRPTEAYELHVNGMPVTVIQFGAGAVPAGQAKHRLTVTEPPGTVWELRLRARLPDGTWGAFSDRQRIVLAG